MYAGSYDLPAYIDHLAPRIGDLSLVVCLDSGCANYDQLWSTTSLRGLVLGNLEVSLLHEGVHSGDGTGVIAASERVIRMLLDRLEDSHTGQIKLAALATQIPKQRVLQAERTAQVIGNEVWNKFPLQPSGANAGWDAPEMAPWLDKALDEASQRHFGKPAMYMGEGGTIPFMYMLGEKFPKAQFCITGVLGPGSNAHGPNEFLHLPTARKLTLCVADVLAEHARQ